MSAVFVLLLLSFGAVAGTAQEGADQRERAAAQVSPEAKQRDEERRRWWASPEARAERVRSRSAYRGQSSSDALRTARERHGDVFLKPLWPAPDLENDQIERYLGDFAAVVGDGHGPSNILQSNLPLRAETESGAKAPIDLALVEGDDSFEPRTSARQTLLPKRLSDGLRFERSGIRLTPLPAAGAAPAQDVDGKLFYANSSTDTDVAVAPTPLGAESLLQLRSPESPERHELAFDLPAEARLQLRDGGHTAEVVRGTERLLWISPALAFDAQGQTVPVSYALEGDRLVLRVDHQAGDWAYPILVDPEYWELFDFTATEHESFTGWETIKWGSTDIPYTFMGDEGRGITSYIRPGTPVTDGHYRAWIWKPERSALQIYKAHSTASHDAFFTRLGRGIWSPSRDWRHRVDDLSSFTARHVENCVSPCLDNASTDDAEFWQWFGPTAPGEIPASEEPYSYLQTVRLFIHDRVDPRIVNAPDPLKGTWQKENKTSSFTVSARDEGGGMNEITLKGPGVDQISKPQCTGQRDWRCPLEAPWTGAWPWSPDFSYNTNALNEGTNTLTTQAKDITGRLGAASWQVKVDKSLPTIDTPTGSLYTGRTTTLTKPSYDLSVTARDAYSGVKNARILIDGEVVAGNADESCPDACPTPVSRSYTFRPDDWEPGVHTIRVEATDKVGHAAAARQWTVTVERGTGELSHFQFEEEGLSDRLALETNVANGNLVARAQELKIAGTGLDLEVNRFYNSRAANVKGAFGPGWSMSTGQDVKMERLPDGTVNFHGPSGEVVRFTQPSTDASGVTSYKTPKGVKADLTRRSDQTYRLTVDQSREKYIFSTSGRFTQHVDKNDHKIALTYDASGRIAQIKDTQDRIVAFSYNADGTVDKMVDRSSAPDTTRYRTYNYNYTGGRLTEYIDPAGGRYTFGYDASGRLDWTEDTRRDSNDSGVRTDISYVSASDNRVASIKRAVGKSEERTRSYNYAPTFEADPCAGTEKDGNPVETDPRRSTDGRGQRTTYCADEFDRVWRVKDAKGNTRNRKYDADSNVVSYANASESQAQGEYENRNLRKATKPEGSISTFDYDASSQPHMPSSVTDPQGNTLSYSYDSRGNLTATAGQGGSERQNALRYNNEDTEESNRTGPNGTLRTSTEGRGLDATEGSAEWDKYTTVYRYDSKGNLIEEDPPGQGPEAGGSAQGRTRYEYDERSRVIAVTDGNGRRRDITYDALDRITKIRFSDCKEVRYSFDRNGNRTRRTESDPCQLLAQDRVTEYDYDALGRLSEERFPDGKENTYAYDKADNLTSLTDPTGTTTYTYDAVNLVRSVTEPCSGPGGLCGIGESGPKTTFAYDKDNNRIETHFPNGITQVVTYDKDERIDTILARKPNEAPLTSFDYGYTDDEDVTGRENRQREQRQAFEDRRLGEKTSYEYDFLTRLSEAETRKTNPTEDLVDRFSYHYDDNSNALYRRTHDGVDTRFLYNENNELRCSYRSDTAQSDCPLDATTYNHDDAGNLTGSSEGLIISYDAKNHTQRVTPPGGLPLEMAYAGETQVERTTKGSLSFLQNQLGVGLQEQSSLAGSLLEETTLSFTRDNRGAPLGQRTKDNQERYYYLTDALGSVVAVTDGTGAVRARYGYDPYGRTRPERTSEDGVRSPFRFQGQYLDRESGFYKLGLRYYVPALGRFTQNDPLTGFQDPRRTNRYIYAGDDPVTHADPAGAAYCPVEIVSTPSSTRADYMYTRVCYPDPFTAVPLSGPTAGSYARSCVAGHLNPLFGSCGSALLLSPFVTALTNPDAAY